MPNPYLMHNELPPGNVPCIASGNSAPRLAVVYVRCHVDRCELMVWCVALSRRVCLHHAAGEQHGCE